MTSRNAFDTACDTMYSTPHVFHTSPPHLQVHTHTDRALGDASRMHQGGINDHDALYHPCDTLCAQPTMSPLCARIKESVCLCVHGRRRSDFSPPKQCACLFLRFCVCFFDCHLFVFEMLFWRLRPLVFPRPKQCQTHRK